ncbi:MAG: UTP--glucose-1-phosphate uridylyltransferase [Chloroflexota bacterium]
MTTTFTAKFEPFAKKMQGGSPIFTENFAYYYQQLLDGHTGLIPEAELLPVENLPDAEQLPASLKGVGEGVLHKTAVIKLNGGLGTSMGLEQAKSLLIVKDNLSFLDIIAHQAQQMGVPILLMNSFATDEDTRAALQPYANMAPRPPATFVQNKEPKIQQNDLSPAKWPPNPELEWCPPGHGDLYASLVISGILDDLLAAGYEYAFVSNSDNLGAIVDAQILGFFAENQLPFMMEVADRTEMDKKGGHLAQRSADGQLTLRESAQCPPEDEIYFQDITRHKYFNTNNLWLNLPALKQLMVRQDNKLGLPLIRNNKTVDPRDADSTPVFQLETAMGSAISVFAGAQAIRVPRTRFAPVKKTNDLLVVRSDAYSLTEAYRVVPNPEHVNGRLLVELDSDHYKFVSDLEARFPHGLPSLLNCTHLSVQGDVIFGKNITLQGHVEIINDSGEQAYLPAGAVLTGTHHISR